MRDTEIFIQFRDVPYSIFASRGATTKPNKLIIGLQPEETIELLLMAKTPGLDRQGVRLREIPLDIGLANAFSEYRRRIAYERLLLDLIEGDPTLFVRRDEVEAQWAWIDRIRAAWAEKGITPRPYAAGPGAVGGDRADRARRHQLARIGLGLLRHFDVPAEAESHRRQELVGEAVIHAAAVSGEQGGGRGRWQGRPLPSPHRSSTGLRRCRRPCRKTVEVMIAARVRARTGRAAMTRSPIRVAILRRCRAG